MTALEEIADLKERLARAEMIRDKYLQEKRDAEEHLRTEMDFHQIQLAELRGALAFAASVIKSGEAWTEHCEQRIGKLLRA